MRLNLYLALHPRSSILIRTMQVTSDAMFHVLAIYSSEVLIFQVHGESLESHLINGLKKLLLGFYSFELCLKRLLLGFYSFELCLKLIIHGAYFFVDEDWNWNVMDLVLITHSLSEDLTKALRIIKVLQSFNQLRVMFDALGGAQSKMEAVGA